MDKFLLATKRSIFLLLVYKYQKKLRVRSYLPEGLLNPKEKRAADQNELSFG